MLSRRRTVCSYHELLIEMDIDGQWVVMRNQYLCIKSLSSLEMQTTEGRSYQPEGILESIYLQFLSGGECVGEFIGQQR